MADITIQIFPPSSFMKYKQSLKQIYADGCSDVTFEENDTILTPEGMGSLPDVVQIWLTPETAKIFFEYLLYFYGVKKLANGIIYLGKKVIDGIASEAGKDIYKKIKQSIKQLLQERRARESQGICNPLWICLKGNYKKSLLILRFLRSGDIDVISDHQITFIFNNYFELFSSSILPVIDRVIEILGSQNTTILADFSTHHENNSWTIQIFKVIDPNHKRLTLDIYCVFDSGGICQTFEFTKKMSGYTQISDKHLKALREVRKSLLSK